MVLAQSSGRMEVASRRLEVVVVTTALLWESILMSWRRGQN